MTNKEITMIENSWDYIILNVEEAGELFYSRLFEIDPGLRALFKSDVRAQSGKLTSMITFLVQKLNSLDEIKKDIVALALRHNNYHVKAEHYQTVGEALLWTLEQGLGPQWNEDLKSAWTKLYVALSNMMIEASQKN